MNNETEKLNTSPDSVAKLEAELAQKRQIRRRRSRIRTSIVIVALTALVAVIAVLLVRFRDRLSPDSIRQYVNIRSSGSAITTLGGAADVVTGNSAVFAAYADGLSVVTTTSVRYSTPDGRRGFAEDAVFASPALSASGSYLLVYDRSGTTLLLFDENGLCAQGETDGKIISASVSEKGVCSVISETDGYISTLTVFDKKLSPVYKWFDTEYYCISSAYHDASKKCAVSAVFEQDGELFGRILIFSITEEGIAHSLELGLSVPTELWASETGFTAVTENGAAFVGADGSLLSLSEFDDPVSGYSPDGDGGIFILLYPCSINEKYALIHASSDGTLSKRVSLNEDVFAFHASNGILGILTGRDILLYNTKADVERIISPDSDIINIAVIRGGRAVLFSADGLSVS